MRWFLRRRKSAPSREATAARERAEEALERARTEAPKWRTLTTSLRRVQERNHLAEAWDYSARGNHS